MATLSDAKPIKQSTLQVNKLELVRSKKKIEQPEESTAVFTERRDLRTSPFEYPREGSNPGLVLIFNQERFLNLDPRIGTRRDVNEIITCMSRLGFNINAENIFIDLNRDEILDKLDKVVEMDLSQVNCLILFFLSHGDSFNDLHACDTTLKANEIWEKISKCDQLKDKPKLFVFQACKGGDHSTVSEPLLKVVGEKGREHELVPFNTFASNSLAPDMLVVYAATEGNLSFRNPVTGTWFIQELCKIFSAYGRRDDVVSLIIRTTKCVCGNYSYVDGCQIKKQMPLFVSTLKKRFYLNRSKDRDILLHILNEQEKMWNCIHDLQKKTEELLKIKK